MRKIRLPMAACAASLFALISLQPGIVYGATAAPRGTRISGLITANTVWTADNSPYVLTGQLTISNGATLTMMPGTIVDSDPIGNNIDFENGSTLIIQGSAANPVTINNNVFRLGVSAATATIAYAHVQTQGAVFLSDSKVRITNSTFSSSTGAGFYVTNSQVTISSSTISNNARYGMYVVPDGLSGLPGSLSIHGSTVAGNDLGAIDNQNAWQVSAENNWWGTGAGPNSTSSNSVIGPVAYTPWLTSDPMQFSSSLCCSSILFLPGLEGTRLYKPDTGFLGIGSSTNTLWEPNRNADVQKLYLNVDGTSSDQTIYSGQPINNVFGVYSIYGKFMSFLDSLVRDGSIGEWQAFGYDWRKPIADVVLGNENRATTTDSLLDVVSRLASQSKTGKVTIIAHSNGGLIAKYLAKTLADIGKADLIESVISVAVPYLGTPEAIGGLLHGEHQSILHGLIAKESIARGLGQNMSSAYSLLPSAEYFAHVFAPTIAFASTTVPGVNDGSYLKEIHDQSNQEAFITDNKTIRTNPSVDDVVDPLRGNRMLMAATDVLHGILDPFSWPGTIAKWAIVGWDQHTTTGLLYKAITTCGFVIGIPSCAQSLAHDTLTSLSGDGTVISPSAGYNSGTPISIDLAIDGNTNGTSMSHANIMESTTTQTAIRAIVTHEATTSTVEVHTALATLPGVNIGSMPAPSNTDELRISTHSPVELNMYDSQGRHTGPIAMPQVLAGDDYYSGAYEANIPGSDYRSHEASDGQESYITVPYDPSQKFSIAVNGTNFGFATLDIETISNGNVTKTVEFAQFPVTPLSIATTTTVSNVLSLDSDGDGIADSSQNSTTSISVSSASDPDVAANAAKKLVLTLAGSDPHARQLVQRIDHIIDLAHKGKLKQVTKQGNPFVATVGHVPLKSITADEKNKILSAIEAMVTSVEQVQ